MIAAPLSLGSRWCFADPARLEPLKWLAVLAMICDHLAITLLPQYPWLRQIGTFAFPVFFLAFGIGLAATRHPYLVARRLLIPACIAQVAWQIIDPGHSINVLFVCAACALALSLFHHVPWPRSVSLPARLAVPLGSLVLFSLIGVEGGVLGIAFVFGAYLAAQNDSGPWSDALLIVSVALWFALVPSIGFALAVAAVFLTPRLPFVFPRRAGLLAGIYAAHLVVLAIASRAVT